MKSRDKWNLTGKNVITGEPTVSTAGHFTAGGALAQLEEASGDHVNRALEAAEKAFHEYRQVSAEQRAAFLDRIGAAAILRIARPIAYQNFPQSALPVELQDANPRKIWRFVDGETTKESF